MPGQASTKVDVWMPLYVSDFLTATLGWSAEERGHYMILLMAQWSLGGLPADTKSLERISPGVSDCWETLSSKFPEQADGKLRNLRLEEHRATAIHNREARVAGANAANEAKRARAEAAKRLKEQQQSDAQGTLTDTLSVTLSDTVSDTLSDTLTDTLTAAPSPSPSPSSLSSPSPSPPRSATLRSVAKRDARGEDDWRKPGWVHDEWAKVVARWNATERAEPWKHLNPPNDFVDVAATPGRLADIAKGIEMLPGCIAFNAPVPWTQFMRMLDRIIAREFRTKDMGSKGGKRSNGNRGNM